MELKLHVKLDLHELEFQKSGILLIIFANSGKSLIISAKDGIWPFLPKVEEPLLMSVQPNPHLSSTATPLP